MFIAIFAATMVQSQEKVVLPPGYQVDTRIDNMGYWRKMAELGLVTVQPETRIPAPVYTGSKLISKGMLVGDSPDVPVTTEPSTESENSVVVNPNDKSHVLNSNNSSGLPASSNFYGANYLHSFDEGVTWEGQLQGAGGSNSGDPVAVINLTGRYYINYIDNAYGQSVSYSDDNGATWAVSKVSNGSMFNMLDKNHLWCDISPTSPYKGYLFVGWMESNMIYVSRSITNGTSWEAKKNISAGTNAGSHNQGINFKCGPDGEVYAAWSVYDSWPGDEKAIGFAKSLDGGITWEPGFRAFNNIKGIRTTGVSQNMRVNSFPCMAVDLSNGPHRGDIYIVWTNIGVPGVNTGTGSDVYVIKSTDKGATWSTPVKINQDPAGAGKYHYLSWVTCDQANGTLSCIFYDNRNVSASQTETFMAWSEDGGTTWQDMKVSDVAATPSPIPGMATGYMGDYLGIAAYDGKVYPTWTDTRSGNCMTYVSAIDLVIPASNLIEDAHALNDAAFGNGDGMMGYGETELLGVKIKNIGNKDADSVWVTLTTTSPYITFEDSTEFYGDIAQGQSVNIADGFKYAVAQDVPNDLDIEFTCTAKGKADSATVSVFNMTAKAPAPTIISLAVDDNSGNNNGRLDPGETVTINILTKNTGPYDAENVISTLVSNNPYVTIDNGTFPIGTMTPGQAVNAVYTLHVSNEAYLGSAVILHNVAQALYQSDTRDFVMPIGLIVEDWETGNFLKFAWQLSGDANWTIDPTTKWEGNYGSKSGTIGDSQATNLVLQYNVMFDDSISFYRKVSSQLLSNDKLKFFIDNLLVGAWSGAQEWKRVAYPILAGPHTLRWTYEKDPVTAGGSDAAWLDFIVFPPEYKLAVTAGPNATACGMGPFQLQGMAINYDSLVWTTSGTGVFSDPQIMQPTYTPSMQDAANGSVTLTLKAYNSLGDSTDQMLLTIAPETTASAGSDASVCSNSGYSLDAATASNYTGVSWATSGDGTFNDNTLLNPVYTPGPQDIANETAALVLTAIPASTCPNIVDSLMLTIKPSPVVSLGVDTSICANHSYILDATNPDAAGYLWTPGGATTAVLTVDSTGIGLGTTTVSVVVTGQNGCTGTDAVNITFKDCLGIGEINGVEVKLYPNPTKGQFTLEILSATNETLSISLISARGEQIANDENINVNRTFTKKFDISNLPQGTYLLEISKGTSRIVKKVILGK